MLVLSRREAEKVLFPGLGITVEITRVQGNTVRLGIDAPKEIRVIRGELEDRPELAYSAKNVEPQSSKAHGNSFAGALQSSLSDQRLELQKCLDAANLAIHLAQNQLRQNLNGHAEVALEQALECLEDLELAVAQNQFAPKQTAVVKESASGYQVQNKATTPIAAVLSNSEAIRRRIATLLNENGFKTIEFAEQGSLIRFLLHSEQPAVVVTRDPVTAKLDGTGPIAEPKVEPIKEIHELQIAGVGGLRRHSRTFSIAPSFDDSSQSNSIQFTAWFADDALAGEFESKNDSIFV